MQTHSHPGPLLLTSSLHLGNRDKKACMISTYDLENASHLINVQYMLTVVKIQFENMCGPRL